MWICVNAREQRETREDQRKECREPERREPLLDALGGGIFRSQHIAPGGGVFWANPVRGSPVPRR